MELTVQQAMVEAKREISSLVQNRMELERIFVGVSRRGGVGITGKGRTEKIARVAFDLAWKTYTEKSLGKLSKLIGQYKGVAYNKSRIAVANASTTPTVPATKKTIEGLLIYKVNWLRELQKNILPYLSNLTMTFGTSEDDETVLEVKYPEDVSGKVDWNYFRRDPEGVTITRNWFDGDAKIAAIQTELLKEQRELEYEIASLNTTIKVA